MGADMEIAIVPYPAYVGSETNSSDASPRLVTDKNLLIERLSEPQYLDAARRLLLDEDETYFNLLEEELQKNIIAANQHQALEQTQAPNTALLTDQVIIDVVSDLIDKVLIGHRRDVVEMQIKGTWYAVTGGLSWGDAPTDACEPIWFLDTIGFLNEPFPMSTCRHCGQPVYRWIAVDGTADKWLHCRKEHSDSPLCVDGEDVHGEPVQVP